VKPVRAGIGILEQLEDTRLSLCLPHIGQHTPNDLPEETTILYHSALECVHLTLHAEIPGNGQDQDRDRQNDTHKFQREFHGQHHLPQCSHPIALQNFASLVPSTVDLQMAPVSARTLQYISRELGRVHAAVLRTYADADLSRDEWQGY
jgi:hypothetical protein